MNLRTFFERYEKATELLNEPVQLLRERLKEHSCLEYVGVHIEERGDENVGLVFVAVRIEYENHLFMVRRHWDKKIEICLTNAVSILTLDEATYWHSFLLDAEYELKQKFNAIFEPLIPESIWSITA